MIFEKCRGVSLYTTFENNRMSHLSMGKFEMECGQDVDILEFLASKKWMLLVLSELYFHGTQRFNELLGNMSMVSPKILSKRLKELEGRKLVKRERFSEIPPRVEYSLTEKGEDLVKSFQDIGEWAIRWESV